MYLSYVPLVYSMYVPSESFAQKHLVNFLYNHHNSNDVPNVYIPSTMIETCTILQYSLSSEIKMYIQSIVYVRMYRKYIAMIQ